MTPRSPLTFRKRTLRFIFEPNRPISPTKVVGVNHHPKLDDLVGRRHRNLELFSAMTLSIWSDRTSYLPAWPAVPSVLAMIVASFKPARRLKGIMMSFVLGDRQRGEANRAVKSRNASYQSFFSGAGCSPETGSLGAGAGFAASCPSGSSSYLSNRVERVPSPPSAPIRSFRFGFRSHRASGP